jgi:alpha-1,3-glucosyltransferase
MGLTLPLGARACTGGLVGIADFAVLPAVGPGTTLALVLAAMAPCLLRLWQEPRPASFLQAAAYACMCSFVFGYHVHEKAILMVRCGLPSSPFRCR